MGTAWDERISLYWTWLNAVLMKAHADNSFFIMSLARLGIFIFYCGEREGFWFFTAAALGGSLVFSLAFDYVFGILFFLYCISARLSLTERPRVWWIVFTPKNRCLQLRKVKLKQLFEARMLPLWLGGLIDTTVISRFYISTKWRLLSCYWADPCQENWIMEIFRGRLMKQFMLHGLKDGSIIDQSLVLSPMWHRYVRKLFVNGSRAPFIIQIIDRKLKTLEIIDEIFKDFLFFSSSG